MDRRHPEWNSELLRRPRGELVGELALALDLGRPLVAEVIEQPGE